MQFNFNCAIIKLGDSMKEYKRILNLKLGAMLPLLLISFFALIIKTMSASILSYLFGACITAEALIMMYAYMIQKKKVFSVFKIDLLFVVLIAVLGIFMMINVTTTKVPLVILVGCYFIIKSLYKFSIPLFVEKLDRQLNTMTITNMILSIVLAIVVFISPFEYLLYVTQTIGLFTIFNCILDIMYYQTLRKNAKLIVSNRKKGK